MKGVFSKEWRHFFKNMTGYVFIAMYLALSGAVFSATNLLTQSGDIKSYFSVFNTVSVLLFPILTMGVFSEERKQKTDELLLTAPVSITAIVLGKYLATLAAFMVPMAVTLVYPIILAGFGAHAWMATVGNYLGLALLAGACIAIGQFLSLLTDSQFVAAITTYAVFVLCLFADTGSRMVADPLLKGALAFLAIAEHSKGFSYGVFEMSQAVYYLSIISLFLFLSVYLLERKRLS